MVCKLGDVISLYVKLDQCLQKLLAKSFAIANIIKRYKIEI